MGKSRSTTTGQSRFIEQYWKVISGVLFAALALGYATNILKQIAQGILFARQGYARVIGLADPDFGYLTQPCHRT